MLASRFSLSSRIVSVPAVALYAMLRPPICTRCAVVTARSGGGGSVLPLTVTVSVFSSRLTLSSRSAAASGKASARNSRDTTVEARRDMGNSDGMDVQASKDREYAAAQAALHHDERRGGRLNFVSFLPEDRLGHHEPERRQD